MTGPLKVRATPTAKKSLEKEHELGKYFKSHHFFINVLGERISGTNKKYEDFCVVPKRQRTINTYLTNFIDLFT